MILEIGKYLSMATRQKMQVATLPITKPQVYFTMSIFLYNLTKYIKLFCYVAVMYITSATRMPNRYELSAQSVACAALRALAGSM